MPLHLDGVLLPGFGNAIPVPPSAIHASVPFPVAPGPIVVIARFVPGCRVDEVGALHCVKGTINAQIESSREITSLERIYRPTNVEKRFAFSVTRVGFEAVFIGIIKRAEEKRWVAGV